MKEKIPEYVVKSLEDEYLSAYMAAEHPRFYQLAERFGSPLDMVSTLKEASNIASTSAKVTLISEAAATAGKTLSKKLLLSMPVSALKAMCSKLFKVEVLSQVLVYIEDGVEGEFEFDEDNRQLSFFSIKDGGKILVREQ